MADREKEIQAKAIHFQVLQDNLRGLQEREEQLIRHLGELNGTRLAIEELKDSKEGDSLIPIGSGNFLFGKVADTKNIIVSIGGAIAVKKNREQALEMVESRIKEVEKFVDEVTEQGQNIIAQLSQLRSEIERLEK